MIYHHIVKRLESSTNYSSFLYCSAHLSDHVGALSWKNRTIRVIIDVFPLLNMQPNWSFSLIVSLFLTCWLPVFCVKNNARIKAYIHSASKKKETPVHICFSYFNVESIFCLYLLDIGWCLCLYVLDIFMIPLLTLFKMGLFGAAHGWGGGAKRPSLPEIS